MKKKNNHSSKYYSPLFLIISFFSLLGILSVLLYIQYGKGIAEKIQRVPKEFASANDPVILAAGDVACNFISTDVQECRQKETAHIVEKINPDAVLVLGDLQYPSGSLDDFISYYDKSWGAFKDKTYPVPGNHEYETPDASGYFEYFGNRAGEKGKGYYSFDLGTWHIIGLNSNCWAVNGCVTGSSQEKWLRQDLEKNTSKCTLAFWHHPFISTGQHGNENSTRDFWKTLGEYKADLILSGHDHIYERFEKMDENGEKKDDGIREFIVGTGGRSLYRISSSHPNLSTSENQSFGVLKLVLHNDSYSWEFFSSEKNSFSDVGKDTCNEKIK